MMHAQVLTRWVGTGAGINDARRPEIGDHYPGVALSDATARDAATLPASPNVLVVDAVMDDVTFAVLSADPRYDGAVLWSEVV